jgi:hypothetical protein
VSVAINTTAVEQHRSIVSRIAGHLSLNLTAEGTSTGAVVADIGLIILLSIKVVVVIHNELGIGVHEQAGQQSPIGPNGLLSPPGSLDNSAVVGPHVSLSSNGSGVASAKGCGSSTVLTSHQVCGRQRTSAAIQVLEQQLRVLFS